MTPVVAVLIPCYNEQETEGSVVAAFKGYLPAATIFVYDNASSDLTIQRAREAGAVVRSEPLRGKGLESLQTALVAGLPSALLATALMLLASLSLLCGLALHTVTRGRVEVKRLFYLSLSPRFRRTP
jgi:cellulose synthase/poly-beta-1,6-N-acetylglucosamine synthase-like glycosyltransferase